MLFQLKMNGFLYKALASKKEKQPLENCCSILYQWYQEKVLNQHSCSKLICALWKTRFGETEMWIRVSYLYVQNFNPISEHLWTVDCLKSVGSYKLTYFVSVVGSYHLKLSCQYPTSACEGLQSPLRPKKTPQTNKKTNKKENHHRRYLAQLLFQSVPTSTLTVLKYRLNWRGDS